MSAIHDLITQVSDPRLRERLAAEWASASKEKKFGLAPSWSPEPGAGWAACPAVSLHSGRARCVN